MTGISLATVKRLFAVSGNRCAFPKCLLELVDRPSGKVTGRICHIRAASPGGPRYDLRQTDEERNGFENLILLCSIHHDVIDADEVGYTVERLTTMKAEHEAVQDPSRPFVVSDELAKGVTKISADINVEGSAVIVVGQNSGQFVEQRERNKERLLAQVADKILDLWNLFHIAYASLIDVTSPLQQYPDLSRMSPPQFEEWLASSQLPEFRKEELRRSEDRTKHYGSIRVWNQLDRASSDHARFNNALLAARPLLNAEVKDAFDVVNTKMRDALSKMNYSAAGNDFKLRSEAARSAFSIQEEIPKLEELIHEKLYAP